LREEYTRYDQYATIVVAALLREPPNHSLIAAAGISFPDGERGPEAKIEVVELMRLDKPWLDVIDEAERVANSPIFDLQAAGGDVVVVVDNTLGTSAIASRILTGDCYAICAVLTAERKARSDGTQQYMPTADVVGALITAYQQGRIEVSEGLELAETLAGELDAVSLKEIDEVGDLVLLVGHVAYQADNMLPSMGGAPVDTYDTDTWGLE